MKQSKSKPLQGLKCLALLCIVYLASCAHVDPEDEWKRSKDSGPKYALNVDHISEPTPIKEPRTLAGNYSPYEVNGKRYVVMDDPKNFRQKGIASWYGNKFHGRKTSNGEIYNMYAMTAAHKSLPIPSYVRVTNTRNRRSIIVRVNDRGPFHTGRVIDLSYSAARKLGFASKGTAPVTVEYIDPDEFHAAAKLSKKSLQAHTLKAPQVQAAGAKGRGRIAPTPKYVGGYELPANTFLQVAAFKSASKAELMRDRVRRMTEHPVLVSQLNLNKQKETWFRVRVGPFDSNLDLLRLTQKIRDAKLPEPRVVYN